MMTAIRFNINYKLSFLLLSLNYIITYCKTCTCSLFIKNYPNYLCIILLFKFLQMSDYIIFLADLTRDNLSLLLNNHIHVIAKHLSNSSEQNNICW